MFLHSPPQWHREGELEHRSQPCVRGPEPDGNRDAIDRTGEDLVDQFLDSEGHVVDVEQECSPCGEAK